MQEGGGRGESELDKAYMLTSNKLDIVYICYNVSEISKWQWFLQVVAGNVLGRGAYQDEWIYCGTLENKYLSFM